MSKNNVITDYQYDYSGNYPTCALKDYWYSDQYIDPVNVNSNDYWRWKNGKKFEYEGL